MVYAEKAVFLISVLCRLGDLTALPFYRSSIFWPAGNLAKS